MVLQWVSKDSEIGAHTSDHRLEFGRNPSSDQQPLVRLEFPMAPNIDR